MGVVAHLLGGLGRAIWRILLWFLIFGLIGAAIVEVFSILRQGGPTVVTHVVAAVIGLTLAYAAGLTVLMVEVIRFLIGAVKTRRRPSKATWEISAALSARSARPSRSGSSASDDAEVTITWMCGTQTR